MLIKTFLTNNFLQVVEENVHPKCLNPEILKIRINVPIHTSTFFKFLDDLIKVSHLPVVQYFPSQVKKMQEIKGKSPSVRSFATHNERYFLSPGNN